MSEDARFEDADEAPLNIGAVDAEDLKVLSALVQDAVFTASDIRWDARRRQLALLVNRLRREPDLPARPERVRAMLALEGVTRVQSQGLDRHESDLVLSLLALDFEPDATPPGGFLHLVLAGDGAIRAQVEAIEVRLKDVTRPYLAPSGKVPDHDL